MPYPATLDSFLEAGGSWKTNIRTSSMRAQLNLRTVFPSPDQARLKNGKDLGPIAPLWWST